MYLSNHITFLSSPCPLVLHLMPLPPPLPPPFSPQPPLSDMVACVALMLVWIAALGPIPLLIIWTKWQIDAKGTHAYTCSINNRVCTQAHAGCAPGHTAEQSTGIDTTQTQDFPLRLQCMRRMIPRRNIFVHQILRRSFEVASDGWTSKLLSTVDFFNWEVLNDANCDLFVRC